MPVEYYIQLERGRVRGVSDTVLDAIARALQLDDVERAHLVDLVRAAKRRPSSRGATPATVRPGVQRVLDTITDSAAFVRNGRLDILSANRLAYALYSEVFSNPDRPANLARFVFLDPRSHDFYMVAFSAAMHVTVRPLGAGREGLSVRTNQADHTPGQRPDRKQYKQGDGNDRR